MNTILQKRIEEAVKKTACPQCVFNDGGTCNNDDDCKLFDDFVGLMTFALQNQWISVDEVLPEYDEDVFVRFISRFPNNTDEFEVGYCTRWRTLDKSVKTDSKGFSIIGDMEITHWMSIPELPKGGEE